MGKDSFVLLSQYYKTTVLLVLSEAKQKPQVEDMYVKCGFTTWEQF